MVTTTREGLLTITAQDITGQRVNRFEEVSPDGRISEFAEDILDIMDEPREIDGRPMSYMLRLDREGRLLGGSERIGDALMTDDKVVVMPNVTAG